MPSSTLRESAVESDTACQLSLDSDIEIDTEMCFGIGEPVTPIEESRHQDGAKSDEAVLNARIVSEASSANSRQRQRRSSEFKMPSIVARINVPRSEEQYLIRGYTCPRFASLIPPPNFGAVKPGKLYRSGFPTVESLKFLETLELRTIITLVDTPHPEFYTEWIRENFKDHHTIPLPANKEVVRIKTKDMVKIMAIVTDPDNYPLLIHCNKGKHRTGCVVGAYRKCAGVPMSDILSEYHDYASNKARKLDEKFLENVRPYELMYPLPPADIITVRGYTIVDPAQYYKENPSTWIPIHALA